MKLEELQKQFEDTIEIEENEVLEEKHTDKKSKRKWVFLILVVVLLGIVSILVKQKFLSAPIPEEEKTATAEGAIMNGLPEGMKEGELGDALQQKIDDSMFTINVNTQPIFKNGNSKGKIDIVNNPGNQYPCKLLLTLDENENELYRCDDLIYPEQYIHEIKLSKNLEKGVYPATLFYYVYDKEGEEMTGVVKAGINIVIQN